MKMPDSVLAIQSTDDCTVFAALADGFVAILQVRKHLCEIGSMAVSVLANSMCPVRLQTVLPFSFILALEQCSV